MYIYMYIYTVGESNTYLHLCAFIYSTGDTIKAESLKYTVIALVVKYKTSQSYAYIFCFRRQ